MDFSSSSVWSWSSGRGGSSSALAGKVMAWKKLARSSSISYSDFSYLWAVISYSDSWFWRGKIILRMKNTQEELYDTHIKPNESDLLGRIIWYRKDIDIIFHEKMIEAWFHDPDDQPFRGFRFIQNYPAWYCGEIRNLVLAKLREADIPYIKEFCDTWGILGEEYVGVNHPNGKRWFSNVIQMGNRVIDTAHEEFSGTTLSVNISDFGKIFHPPTVRCYKELTEIYYGQKVLSSFPILGKFSLLFPFLMIDPPLKNRVRPESKNLYTYPSAKNRICHTLAGTKFTPRSSRKITKIGASSSKSMKDSRGAGKYLFWAP